MRFVAGPFDEDELLLAGTLDLGVCVDVPWRYRLTVGGAVSMAEDESSVVLGLDEQLAAMGAR